MVLRRIAHSLLVTITLLYEKSYFLVNRADLSGKISYMIADAVFDSFFGR